MHLSLQIDGISNWLHQQIVETPTPLKDYRILKIIEANRFAFLIRLNNVRQLIDTIKAVSSVVISGRKVKSKFCLIKKPKIFIFILHILRFFRFFPRFFTKKPLCPCCTHLLHPYDVAKILG